MNLHEAVATWRSDRAEWERLGVVLPEVRGYVADEARHDYRIAMDAFQPTLVTDPNSAVPAMLTTMIDPDVFEILFAPSKATEIYDEVKRGSWVDETIMFPVVEAAGEVSSYGDFANNGHATVNTNWPQRQMYLFQIIKQYGEREMERAGLARINWVSELDKSAALQMAKFQNFSYFFGIQGLENYGILNSPGLSAALTPAPKAAGGTAWIVNGVINATPNEIYLDIESLFYQLVYQTAGLVALDSQLILAMSPGTEVALTATNNFNVNVGDLIKKNFPNITIVTAVQYGVRSTQNPQGVTGGNLVQMIAPSLEGQKTGFLAYNEKMRAHPIIRMMSSFKQKVSGGTWGAVIRMPAAVSSMLGV